MSARAPRRGFSLLEMMVALAILSIGLTLLFQVQARSIQLAQEARGMTIATQLARGKLLDCETDLLKKGFSIGDYNERGNFDDEGQPSFFWECHGYKPDMPVAEVSDITDAAQGDGASSDPGTAPAGGLGGLAGAAGAAGAGAGADMGMAAIAPVLSQMSSVLGDSIRELVVIVRWGTGEDMQEMTVTTHVIDKTAVNQVAAMIKQFAPKGAGTGAAAEEDSEGSSGKGGKKSRAPSGTVPKTSGAEGGK